MRARLLLALLVLLAGCGRDAPKVTVVATFEQGSSTLRIEAELAATPDARTRGLMGRSSLGRDAGMLFVFPTLVQTGFWMKDTLIPLDIAFISQGRVVEVRTMTPCRASPCPLTTPSFGYDQAVEVNAGVFGRAGIQAGSSVRYDRRLPTAS